MKEFKTKKGTVLPLLDLRGKDYLLVAHRLVWWREECPDWSCETEIIKTDDKHTLAKATVRNEQGRIMATAHKMEEAKDFKDHIEKAESSALGRALAMCGYGTQFAPDMDESDRIVDSPVHRQKPGLAPSQNEKIGKPTQDQLKSLARLMEQNGWYPADTADYTHKHFGMLGAKELNMTQYNLLVAHIIATPRKDFAPAVEDMTGMAQ